MAQAPRKAAGQRALESGGVGGEVFLAELADLRVDVHHDALLDTGMPQHLARGRALAPCRALASTVCSLWCRFRPVLAQRKLTQTRLLHHICRQLLRLRRGARGST